MEDHIHNLGYSLKSGSRSSRARDKTLRLAERRWNLEVWRRQLRSLSRARPQRLDETQRGSGYQSKVLDALCSKAFANPASRPKGHVFRFVIPEVFSFSKNALETIALLRRIALAGRSVRNPRIVLDHRPTTYMGLAADTVLALVLTEIQRETPDAYRSYVKGYKPRDPKVRKMMEEISSVRAFQDFEDIVRVDFRPSPMVFRFHNRNKMGEMHPFELDVASRMSARFADHLNSGLGLIGRKLTMEGAQKLLEYVGEVVSNAEDHSGTKEWALVGYIDRDGEALSYRCVIVSIGLTIAQNFQSLAKDSFAWHCVRPYIDEHSNRGFWNSGWQEEDLLAVVALQGDISTLNVSPEGTRGQGTVDLIEFFQGLRDECDAEKEQLSEMHLLTGRSLIKFGEKYSMRSDPVSGRKTIAFNSSNSLADLPDSSCVKSLPGSSFPGVLISISIPLGLREVRVAEGATS